MRTLRAVLVLTIIDEYIGTRKTKKLTKALEAHFQCITARICLIEFTSHLNFIAEISRRPTEGNLRARIIPVLTSDMKALLKYGRNTVCGEPRTV